MKYIHVILPSKRMMNTYVSMIRENFNEEETKYLFTEYFLDFDYWFCFGRT